MAGTNISQAVILDQYGRPARQNPTAQPAPRNMGPFSKPSAHPANTPGTAPGPPSSQAWAKHFNFGPVSSGYKHAEDERERYREQVCKEGKVEIYQSFNSRFIQKQYPTYLITYEKVYDRPRFRKRMNGSSDEISPTADEIVRFQVDVFRTARKRQEIAAFMKNAPGLEPSAEIKERLGL